MDKNIIIGSIIIIINLIGLLSKKQKLLGVTGAISLLLIMISQLL